MRALGCVALGFRGSGRSVEDGKGFFPVHHANVAPVPPKSVLLTSTVSRAFGDLVFDLGERKYP